MSPTNPRAPQGEHVDKVPVARSYELRLVSAHGGDANELLTVDVELRRPGEAWAPLAPDAHSSPFLGLLHCAFLCQLAYLRMNSAERGLLLAVVHGRAEVDTVDFVIRRFVVAFAIELRGGEASDADLEYLRARCLDCPVSRNLPHVLDKDTIVTVGLTPPTT